MIDSLNASLLTPTICTLSAPATPYDPDREDGPNDYPLSHRRVDHHVVVASTGWTDSTGWSAVGNGQIGVERGSLDTWAVPVATPAQADVAAAGSPSP